MSKYSNKMSDDNIDANERKSCLDNVDDYLLEDILSYLPLKVKFRFQRISQRIQYLIFNGHKSLNESEFQEIVDYNQMEDMEEMKDNESQMEVKYELFEDCLQKFRLLKHIHIVIVATIPSSSRLLSLVANNCPRLKGLTISFEEDPSSTEESIKVFVQKLGPSIKFIEIRQIGCVSADYIIHLLSYLPNVRKFVVKNYGLGILSLHNTRQMSDKLLPNLKSFTSDKLLANELTALVSQYHDQLVKLDVTIMETSPDCKYLKRFLCGHYAELRTLHLKIVLKTEPTVDYYYVWRLLAQLGLNCHKLTTFLIIQGDIHDTRSYKMSGELCKNNISCVFSSFLSLNSLKITLCPIPRSIGFSLLDLITLKRLRHLELSLASADNDLAFIARLPQLMSLAIKTSNDLTDRSLGYLSQLILVKSLVVHWITDFAGLLISEKGVSEVIANCLYLRRIVFRFTFNGNQWNPELIERIAQTVKDKPRIWFTFRSSVMRNDSYKRQITERNLPDNFQVDI